ncbi:MAG: hypothetical protein JSW00_16530 [Thermoplasmata archaeon]|nr:MAG: hypothetical protein JSW00_16530 [Thermoplasmata archaeon]
MNELYEDKLNEIKIVENQYREDKVPNMPWSLKVEVDRKVFKWLKESSGRTERRF